MKGFAVRTSGGQGPALCVEIRVYADIFYESRCNSAVKLKSELIFIKF